MIDSPSPPLANRGMLVLDLSRKIQEWSDYSDLSVKEQQSVLELLWVAWQHRAMQERWDAQLAKLTARLKND